jgi:methylenetetrahydrofolate dehydrogenase (NADP+) / methenyltetrahydrofolate cyclohydrolase
MTARVLDGTAVANALRVEVGPAVAAFTAWAGRPPGLGIVLVGDDPASEI